MLIIAPTITQLGHRNPMNAGISAQQVKHGQILCMNVTISLRCIIYGQTRANPGTASKKQAAIK